MTRVKRSHGQELLAEVQAVRKSLRAIVQEHCPALPSDVKSVSRSLAKYRDTAALRLEKYLRQMRMSLENARKSGNHRRSARHG
jgi:hypothetical protein